MHIRGQLKCNVANKLLAKKKTSCSFKHKCFGFNILIVGTSFGMLYLLLNLNIAYIV
jgi:hypothetical protein